MSNPIKITELQILDTFRTIDLETSSRGGGSYRIFRNQVLGLAPEGELARQACCEFMHLPTGYRNVGFVEVV